MTDYRAKIRMYRHGLGDCLLVRLAGAGETDYRILIDCGVIPGTTDAKSKIDEVVDDIVRETDGKIDLLVVTHAHADHVSGFPQAKDRLLGNVGEVWMSWMENPDDTFAQSLVAERHKAKKVLEAAENQMKASGNDHTAKQVASLMDFFGADKGRKTTEGAVQVARDLAPKGKLRYCEPGQAPFRPPGVNARIMVLGPPRDKKLIRKSSPSKRAPETFSAAGLAMFMNQLGPLAGEEGEGRPFSSLHTIPAETAKSLPFFRKYYWTGAATDDDWRGIDDIWTDSALDLALKLDSDTNNSSLVLAIELDGDSPSGQPGRDVLLFAADAQVGNWLSWPDVKWSTPEAGEPPVNGRDLVRRTLVYKVGHHGSHNATLKDPLGSMKRLLVALNPVDEEMAKKKGWDHIPLPSLEKALNLQSGKRLVRADKPLPAAVTRVIEDRLFYEVIV